MEKALKKHAPIFVLPTFLAFVIGFIIPFAQGFYLSFCKFTTVGNATWVGLANYRAAITDTSFQRAFGFTVLFAVVSILSINILAFALAVYAEQMFSVPCFLCQTSSVVSCLVISGRS